METGYIDVVLYLWWFVANEFPTIVFEIAT